MTNYNSSHQSVIFKPLTAITETQNSKNSLTKKARD